MKSGNEEFTLNVTEEEYQRYYRPWWSQRKREQRNREAFRIQEYLHLESYDKRVMASLTASAKVMDKGMKLALVSRNVGHKNKRFRLGNILKSLKIAF